VSNPKKALCRNSLLPVLRKAWRHVVSCGLPELHLGLDLLLLTNFVAWLHACASLIHLLSEMGAKIASDRRIYLAAMAEIKQGMMLGVDKNIYVELAKCDAERCFNAAHRIRLCLP
jgi:hypothetical protein